MTTTSLAAGHYVWTGAAVTPSIPFTPDPEPGDTIPDAGPQGERWFAAVQHTSVTGGRGLGSRFVTSAPITLWGSSVKFSDKDRRLGPNTVSVTCPADPVTMRILGGRLEDTDWAGRHLYDPSDLVVGMRLLVGSTLTGKVRRRYVVRDEVQVEDGMVTINGRGFVGGLSGDVVIGAPERENRLNKSTPGRGSFTSGTLKGWTLVAPEGRVVCTGATATVGDMTAEVVPGGVDGFYNVRIKGTPDAFHYLEATYPASNPAEPWGQQRVAGTAFVDLPSGVDIDNFTLVTIGVQDLDGTTRWPPGGLGTEDPEASAVTSEMVRGSYDPDPTIGYGKLPTPPFNVHVCYRLHAVDETHWVYYSGCDSFLRENTSTRTPLDLTHHVKVLWNHADHGRDKSRKGVAVTLGEPFGTAEIGTWWHQDGQSLDDAWQALAGRGFDIWDDPDGSIHAALRKGADRDDAPLHWWDLLGVVGWRIDPGGQRSALRMTSAANSVWGGSDVGAISTTHSAGQVIDVLMSAPVGMTPTKLRSYAATQLGTLKLVQSTLTVLVPWRIGRRYQVGDVIPMYGIDGVAALSGRFGVTQWAPDFEQGYVAMDVGKVD